MVAAQERQLQLPIFVAQSPQDQVALSKLKRTDCDACCGRGGAWMQWGFKCEF